MRKRNCKYFFDTLFWYILYTMPPLLYIVGYWTGVCTSVGQFFTDTGLGTLVSPIYTVLANIFSGVDGILPLFDNPAVLQVFSWFVSVMILHLAVDFLLFIPRLCHKFMDCLGGDDD